MRVFLVWKRRCADVRAGTQAPPLPFQHVQASCKSENKNFNARSNAASIKTQKTMLAVTLQALKSKITTIKEQFFLFNTLKAFHDG